MKPDDLERQLQRQPLRPVPPEWRQKILTAARSAARTRPSPNAARSTPWWRELLWPSPVAWAGAAAAWALILALNSAASPDADTLAARRAVSPPASVIRMALAERRLLMASILDPEFNTNPPPDPVRPRPHSGRRPDWIAT